MLATARMSADAAERLAGRLQITLRELSVRISHLRRLGAARTVHLHIPARMGRPLHSLTYVALRHQDRAAIAAFEAWCVVDPVITQAALLAGRCDYALWTWHADERAANAWRRATLLRPEVARAESRFVNVVFGHTLAGAPLYTFPAAAE